MLGLVKILKPFCQMVEILRFGNKTSGYVLELQILFFEARKPLRRYLPGLTTTSDESAMLNRIIHVWGNSLLSGKWRSLGHLLPAMP
jgi:hypothetical protein